MTLIDSDYWPIILLIITNIIGPIVTYRFQEGRIANLKLGLDKSSLQMEKDKHIIDMFASLNKSLSEYWVMREDSMNLFNARSARDGLDIHCQRKLQELHVKGEEILQIRIILAELTGRSIDDIASFPPAAPTNVRIE